MQEQITLEIATPKGVFTGTFPKTTKVQEVTSLVIEEMALARADSSYPKLMNRLHKTDLLAIDDYGLAPLSQVERRDLLEVIEDRTGRRATLVTSQLPFEHWHDVIGDATFADAILDRLVHHAHRITLKGASMRRKEPPTPVPQTVTA